MVEQPIQGMTLRGLANAPPEKATNERVLICQEGVNVFSVYQNRYRVHKTRWIDRSSGKQIVCWTRYDLPSYGNELQLPILLGEASHEDQLIASKILQRAYEVLVQMRPRAETESASGPDVDTYLGKLRTLGYLQ